MPQVRKCAVFCFRFRTDDWKQVPRKTEHLK
jgi:hypothetical protein